MARLNKHLPGKEPAADDHQMAQRAAGVMCSFQGLVDTRFWPCRLCIGGQNFGVSFKQTIVYVYVLFPSCVVWLDRLYIAKIVAIKSFVQVFEMISWYISVITSVACSYGIV